MKLNVYFTPLFIYRLIHHPYVTETRIVGTWSQQDKTYLSISSLNTDNKYVHWANVRYLTYWSTSGLLPSQEQMLVRRSFSSFYKVRRRQNIRLKLTLSHLQTHFNATAADDFWKHCGKRRNSAIVIATLYLLSIKKSCP